MATVQVAVDAGVATLTLDRPDKRNALSAAMIEELLVALERVELDAAVRVVAIRGAGSDFCAGADLAELLASVERDPDQNRAAAGRLGEVFLRIRAHPHPVVAVVQGRALAGGAGLATACDLVLAGEGAAFGYPEIQRGFVPAMVMTILRRLTGEMRARELALTGRILSAREAWEAGLVSRVIPDAELDREAGRILADLAGASANALTLTKRLIVELDRRTFEEGIELGAGVNAMSRMHPDFKAAVARFLK